MDQSNIALKDRAPAMLERTQETVFSREEARPRSGHGKLRRSLVPTILMILVLIGGAVLVFYGAHPQQGADRIDASQARPVATASATKGDLPIILEGLGTVTPLATVTVKTQINGRLVQLGFEEGQFVRKGDFLAQIDPRPYQYALDQAEGQLARDQALLINARRDLYRYQALLKRDFVPRQQVDTQEALVRQYEATVRLDQAQIGNARLNLEYCRIVAPISGRVGLRMVDLGNFVQTSDSGGIVVITQTQPITAVFPLPEDHLPEITRRVRAGTKLPAVAYDRSDTTEIARGALLSIDNQVDTATGTFKLKAQFDNGEESLFPNQFVNVRLLVDILKETTVVPKAAIQRGAPGTFVFVVNPDKTVSVQTVKLGPEEGDRIAILSGIEPGAKVIIDGADRLHDRSRITEAGKGHHSHPSGSDL